MPDNYEPVNITFARCNWKVDPAIDSISGSVNYYFVPSQNIDSISFDLSSAMLVDSVIVDQLNAVFQRSNDLLKINFPSTKLGGQVDSVCIYYHGQPVSTGNGSFEIASHSGAPILWTLSEPYGAKDWWPCRQNTADKIDSMEINCHIPFGDRCASNGKLLSVENVFDGTIYHWKTNYPIAPYLVAIGVTNYAEISDTLLLANQDTMPILNYVFPEDSANVYESVLVTKSLLEFYDSLLIDYPFSKEKYGHAQFGWGGGMEHQTMSFVGSFDFELVAHEMVHQWFGDYSTCESWKDIWLHEGFATYMAGMTIERFHPEQWFVWKQNALDDIIRLADGSVLCDDTTDLSRIFNGRLSYHKGAFLLHMLRWKYGDAIFANALRNYLNDQSLAYDYCQTDQLKLAFQQATGEVQDRFFNEWYSGQGYPSYSVEWNNTDKKVDLTISQTTSDASVSFFHIPIPIQFSNDLEDTIIAFDPVSNGQSFSADLNFIPKYVNIDPEVRIISARNDVRKKLPPGSITDVISIFPNPSEGQFEIRLLDNSIKLISFSLVDMTGRLVLTSDIPDDHVLVIDQEQWSDGIYTADVMTDKGHFYQKIILKR
jgi:aminopeptidase N